MRSGLSRAARAPNRLHRGRNAIARPVALGMRARRLDRMIASVPRGRNRRDRMDNARNVRSRPVIRARAAIVRALRTFAM